MYEFIRRENGYRIVKIDPPENRGTSLPPQLPDIRNPSPVDFKSWRNFVDKGTVDTGRIHTPILNSWQRCRSMGVDPTLGKCEDIRSMGELSSELFSLKDIVSDTIGFIYETVKDRGLLVTISDAGGYLISMFGDHRTLLGADHLNFGPGANWSEGSVGTNAIGTALAEGQMLQVSGREHFCESHHSWICSAAPIFNLDSRVMGCVDISGPMTSDHSDALTLAVKGARILESRLIRCQSMELRRQSSRIISSAFNTVMTGLIFLDLAGRIQVANPIAASLLGKQSHELIGCPMDTWCRTASALEKIKAAPRLYAEKGFSLKWRLSNPMDVRLYPVTTSNDVVMGFILVLKELQGIRRAPPFPAKPDLNRDPFQSIIGQSSAINKALETARRVADTSTTVLITGDSGTGKEILAQSLHCSSSRSKGPFVAVNCGAIPRELIQSELFGYATGAFTGAKKGGSPGKFEQASKGTLFLDEIAEMPLFLQVNLLRILEEGQVTRVGGTQPIPIDVRIIAATNKDLKPLVEKKKLRQDLFYRLNVVKIHLPPLRDRGNDLTLLATYFIGEMAEKLGRKVRSVDPLFYAALKNYEWPGNVRELKYAIEGAIALMSENRRLSAECLPTDIRKQSGVPVLPKPGKNPDTNFSLKAMEEETIQKAQQHFSGNVSQMAKALGIGRNTLYAKLKKHRISKG
ncbi:sigma-54-dependent Fis family transcriptional regulator [Desulfospira joergensenii]|uniref:sigma-54-dependent Fis family transcriptional regulator n=1 Tax=Desulfospira joergensenii TaxID=53329 RepID=UPI0003B69E33|nr:sigma-54-dependent Fis family transcriptional regulator [Desulfospira joergensenii]